MSGCHNPYSYYGDMSQKKPTRSLSEDILKEYELNMIEELKSMEERVKRHITECKREVIRELIALYPGPTNPIKKGKDKCKKK
jgi:hypothetical protein